MIYATPPCVITPRSPVQAPCAVLEHLWLTRPYVPKARTLGSEVTADGDHLGVRDPAALVEVAPAALVGQGEHETARLGIDR